MRAEAGRRTSARCVRAWLALALLAPGLSASGCAGRAETSPLQRQAIETHYIEGDYETIFRATRTAFQNEGFMIEQSELASGFLNFSAEIPNKRKGLAFGLGFLPGGGSFYTGRYGLGIVDVILYPYSILWDGPLAALSAERSVREMRVTVTLIDLGEQSEIRTGFSREEVDEEYAITLRRLFAEIQRQVMLRDHRDAGLSTGGRKPSAVPSQPVPVQTGSP